MFKIEKMILNDSTEYVNSCFNGMKIHYIIKNCAFIFSFVGVVFMFLSGCDNLNPPSVYDPLEIFEKTPPTLSTPADNATGVSTSTILSWNVVNEATSYTLQVSTASNFIDYVYNKSGLTSSNQQITKLSYNTKYFWRVNASNSLRTSIYSSVYSFTTVIAVTPFISGKVTNISNYGISNVKIYTIPSTSTVYSDDSGNYSINNISGGTYTVFAEKAGYINYSVSIDVAQGAGYVQNIKMTASDSGTPCPGTPTVTYNGKIYNTVLIGIQCWFKENLNIGNRISVNQNASNNGIIEKYCYDDDENNCNIYGGLYQWQEAMAYNITEGTKGICPTGWHLPTKAEFETLTSIVKSDGNSLKAVTQGYGAGEGTNTSGFSALLAGCRGSIFINEFSYLRYNTYIWSSTEYSTLFSGYLGLNVSKSEIIFDSSTKERGFSVRCLKN